MKEKKSFKFIFVFLFFLSWFIPLTSTNASLNAPNIIYPKNSDSPVLAGKIKFKWSNTGANYYKYHINLPTGASKEGITNATIQEIYDLGLGDYSWAVSSCSDSIGIYCGDWSSAESFTVESAPSKLLKGLVPCGRKYDNPETDITESKPCELTDIFVLIKYVLDFVLWRIGLIALVLLTIFTAVVSYFSLGTPGTIINIKQSWQRIGTGYLIMFFAWIIINMILRILGFSIKWWIIPF